jgi:hypothetical protein
MLLPSLVKTLGCDAFPNIILADRRGVTDLLFVSANAMHGGDTPKIDMEAFLMISDMKYLRFRADGSVVKPVTTIGRAKAARTVIMMRSC